MSSFGNPAEIGLSLYLLMHIDEVGDGSDPLPHTIGDFPGAPHVLDANGRLDTGLLTSIVDSIGGMTSGLAALPDWIVTTNLSLRRAADSLTGPRGTGALVLDTQVLRRGRSSVVTRVDVTNTTGDPVATGWLTCAILTPANGPPPFVRPVRRIPREIPADPAFTAPVAEFFSLRALDRPGDIALDPSERLRNPWGIMHGGSTSVVLDAAARSLAVGRATAEPTPDAIVTDVTTQFLSPGRIGPIVAHASEIGRRGREVVTRIEVRDHGADDRLVALSTATVRLLD